VLEYLHVSCDVLEADPGADPEDGPVVCGESSVRGAGGVVLAELLTRVRPDVKVMANYLLGRIPELRELSSSSTHSRGGAARNKPGGAAAVSEVGGGGGLLAMFPGRGGVVAGFETAGGDGPGVDADGRAIVRRTGAAAVPVFFGGRNGAVFQLAGLVHRGCGRRCWRGR